MTAIRRRWFVFPVVALVAVWAGLVAIDWFMRFHHFRWQDRLIRHPSASVSAVRGPDVPMSRRTIPEGPYADLTRLAAVDAITQRYGETKPETWLAADEAGYRNDPPTDGVMFPVMVTGDSFMHVQFGEEGSFTRLLENDLGVRVYNHAYPGSGAFWGLHRYLLEGRFRDRPPRVIVWGLLEREIAGDLFAGYVYHVRILNKQEKGVAAGPASATIAWDQLNPRKLKATLPNTSYVSAAVNRLWNVLRYQLFGVMTRDVILSRPDSNGQHYLFYLYNLEAMKWSQEQRNPSQAAWAVDFIRDALRERGSELVVLLIPDKEQIYRELIPERYGPFPESTLIEFEQELRKLDVPVLNLLPTYRDLAADGRELYWRDDTHWRPEAMAIAADQTAALIRQQGLLED